MSASVGEGRDAVGERPESVRPRSGLGLALHHLLVFAVLVLVGRLALHDLSYVGSRGMSPSLLRYATDLATFGLACAAGGACLSMWTGGRWRSTSFAPLRFAFVLFALATGVKLALFQPFDYDAWVRVFVPVSAVAAALLPFVVRRSERPFSRPARFLDFVVFNLCLLPFLAEGALRVAPWFSDAPLLDFDTLSARDRIDRNTWEPGSPRFGFPLNREANYDTERALGPLDAPLVATIGDSFSQGVVPYPFHFTTVAEKQLDAALPGIEIYNIGVGAIGPLEYELLLREQALPLDPDLVVISLFLGNDSEIWIEPTGPGACLAPWFNRRDLRTAMTVKRLRSLRRERETRTVEPSPVEFSNRLYGSMEELHAALPWLDDPLLEEPTFSEQSFLFIEKNRVVQCCWSGTSDFEPLFDSLTEILATAGDVPVAFLLIPDEFQVEDALWERLKDVPPSIPEDELERDLIQDSVRAWLDERNLPYLDLLPLLRAVEPLADGGRHLYKLQDTHFNVRGNAHAGRAFAPFLAGLLNGAARVEEGAASERGDDG